MQSLGMMSFYAGDRLEAEKILDKTALLGLDSKMFDGQSLVLMAFVRLERGDHKGLQCCRHDFARLLEKPPDKPRYRRLSAVVDVLPVIQHHKVAQALTTVRAMRTQIKEPDFDFESATNLLAVRVSRGKLTETHVCWRSRCRQQGAGNRLSKDVVRRGLLRLIQGLISRVVDHHASFDRRMPGIPLKAVAGPHQF